MLYAAIWRAAARTAGRADPARRSCSSLAVVAVLFVWVFPAHRPAAALQRQHRRPHARRRPHVRRPDDPRTRILVVDNYDSFVFTIVGYLQQLGAECEVVRNDAVASRRRRRLRRRAGLARARARPRRPASRMAMIEACAERAQPMLGVCLGHQALGVVIGATVGRAPELLHGKTSRVLHDDTGRPRRAADAVHRDPLPLADHRPRDRAGHAGGQRAHRVRDHHGRPAPRPAAARGAVPPRERAHRGRPPASWPTGWSAAG